MVPLSTAKIDTTGELMSRRHFLHSLLSGLTLGHVCDGTYAHAPSRSSFSLSSDKLVREATQLSIPGGKLMPVPKFLVVHFTCGMSGRSSVAWWNKPQAKGVNAHFVIERDGELLQCRPCNRMCAHAGPSIWKGVRGLNACSIGIELANAGNAVQQGLLFGKYRAPHGVTRATHKNGLTADWENYSEAQLKTCFQLAAMLHEEYQFQDIVGHDDIAPLRKNDPGPLFPMEALQNFCGLTPTTKQ
ncbi:N-acetylmuramoyl-L-alanine amidase [Roseimicrobium gellanilyticum]|uniref:N-acetylmuramoyl-L-alanine amidase n=1 Tax=Roseimicrobium gellanilyticum TaxID=748857 RepID=A0A366H4G4_9BACT|nr:N-acetylmuramoyl-L-alanine amidase [Roseimicrobium gellanilyticum]RBP36903.1 N-acetylmuramoyl-L-alanine amidase [Roseimicrobium gellanilyticum]